MHPRAHLISEPLQDLPASMLESLSLFYRTFKVTMVLYPEDSESVGMILKKNTKIEFSFYVQIQSHWNQ
jgi:hypothetical protein